MNFVPSEHSKSLTSVKEQVNQTVLHFSCSSSSAEICPVPLDDNTVSSEQGKEDIPPCRIIVIWLLVVSDEPRACVNHFDDPGCNDFGAASDESD